MEPDELDTPSPEPCPFCGGEAIPTGLSPTNHWVYCSICGACGPDGESYADAVTLWDIRI